MSDEIVHQCLRIARESSDEEEIANIIIATTGQSKLLGYISYIRMLQVASEVSDDQLEIVARAVVNLRTHAQRLGTNKYSRAVLLTYLLSDGFNYTIGSALLRASDERHIKSLINILRSRRRMPRYVRSKG